MAGRVDVWWARLDLAPETLESLRSDLSDGELQRAARLRCAEHRRRFVAAHGILRRIIGSRLGVPAGAVRFRAGRNGKPELAAPAGSSLHFNLSHSGEVGAYVLADGRDVGVDVERIRRLKQLEGLCRRVLTPGERAVLEGGSGEAAASLFLTAWARKEAVLKASAEGLSRDPSDVEVTVRSGEAPRVLAIAGDPSAGRDWCLERVNPAPGYVGAVAYRSPPTRVRCRAWHEGDTGPGAARRVEPVAHG